MTCGKAFPQLGLNGHSSNDKKHRFRTGDVLSMNEQPGSQSPSQHKNSLQEEPKCWWLWAGGSVLYIQFRLLTPAAKLLEKALMGIRAVRSWSSAAVLGDQGLRNNCGRYMISYSDWLSGSGRLLLCGSLHLIHHRDAADAHRTLKLYLPLRAPTIPKTWRIWGTARLWEAGSPRGTASSSASKERVLEKQRLVLWFMKRLSNYCQQKEI